MNFGTYTSNESVWKRVVRFMERQWKKICNGNEATRDNKFFFERWISHIDNKLPSSKNWKRSKISWPKLKTHGKSMYCSCETTKINPASNYLHLYQLKTTICQIGKNEHLPFNKERRVLMWGQFWFFWIFHVVHTVNCTTEISTIDSRIKISTMETLVDLQ